MKVWGRQFRVLKASVSRWPVKQGNRVVRAWGGPVPQPRSPTQCFPSPTRHQAQQNSFHTCQLMGLRSPAHIQTDTGIQWLWASLLPHVKEQERRAVAAPSSQIRTYKEDGSPLPVFLGEVPRNIIKEELVSRALQQRQPVRQLINARESSIYLLWQADVGTRGGVRTANYSCFPSRQWPVTPIHFTYCLCVFYCYNGQVE